MDGWIVWGSMSGMGRHRDKPLGACREENQGKRRRGEEKGRASVQSSSSSSRVVIAESCHQSILIHLLPPPPYLCLLHLSLSLPLSLILLSPVCIHSFFLHHSPHTPSPIVSQ